MEVFHTEGEVMTTEFRTAFAAFATAAALAFGGAVAAQDLPAPNGEVLLTVTGKIGQTNADAAAQYDMDMLQAMDSRSFTTETIWTDGAQTFEGVGLDTLLESLGVSEGTLTATAINDYAVEIPISDAVADGPIIAYARNGEGMSVRDKGPLWIVYPYDDNSDYQSEQVYARSIWQLDRLDVGE